jgi:uncharacterized metal-binding protein
MASGLFHSIASLNVATCYAVIATYTDNPAMYWTVAGAFAGTIITCDLDHDSGTLSEHFVRGISGAAQKVWWAYWFPYRRLVAHRSFISHAPLIGTVVCLVYLFWWMYLAGYPLPPAFVVGLAAVDIVHWLMDWRLFRRIFAQ